MIHPLFRVTGWLSLQGDGDFPGAGPGDGRRAVVSPSTRLNDCVAQCRFRHRIVFLRDPAHRGNAPRANGGLLHHVFCNDRLPHRREQQDALAHHGNDMLRAQTIGRWCFPSGGLCMSLNIAPVSTLT